VRAVQVLTSGKVFVFREVQELVEVWRIERRRGQARQTRLGSGLSWHALVPSLNSQLNKPKAHELACLSKKLANRLSDTAGNGIMVK
jgi:hypothetical protein